MLSSASPDFTFIDKNEKVLQCETWMEVWSLVSEWNAGYFNLRPSFQDRLYGIKTMAYLTHFSFCLCGSCVEQETTGMYGRPKTIGVGITRSGATTRWRRRSRHAGRRLPGLLTRAARLTTRSGPVCPTVSARCSTPPRTAFCTCHPFCIKPTTVTSRQQFTIDVPIGSFVLWFVRALVRSSRMAG
jgi:hypothetical protein